MSQEVKDFFTTYSDFVTKVTSEPSLDIDALKKSMDEIESSSDVKIPRLLTAALGLSQLSKLEKLISLRQQNANYLSSKLSKIKDIQIPKIPDGYEHIYQMYSILISNQTKRDNLHSFLSKKGIFSKIYFDPIHLTQFYKDKLGINVSLPVTEKISKHVLTLPMYPNMTHEEKNYLIDSIFEFFENED